MTAPCSSGQNINKSFVKKLRSQGRYSAGLSDQGPCYRMHSNDGDWDMLDGGLSTGDMSTYKVASYGTQRTVKKKKQSFSTRSMWRTQICQSDSCKKWRDLRTITDFKRTSTADVSVNSAFTNELNAFSTCTVANSANASHATSDNCSWLVERADITIIDMHSVLQQVNIRKAPEPKGIFGYLLQCCTNQLTGVLTSIFSEFLAQSVNSTLKDTLLSQDPRTICPRPLMITNLLHHGQ